MTKAQMAPPVRTQGEPRTVLVVEDNELNMMLFLGLLEAYGCDVLQARDGKEALDLAHQRRPDLILMDMQLPEVSGLEVVKWIKEDDALRSIPIVAVTAFATRGDEKKFRDGGCDAYIAKPIRAPDFFKVIKSLFNEDRARS